MLPSTAFSVNYLFEAIIQDKYVRHSTFVSTLVFEMFSKSHAIFASPFSKYTSLNVQIMGCIFTV